MLTSKKVPSVKKILWPVADLATVPTNAQERTVQTNQRPTVLSRVLQGSFLQFSLSHGPSPTSKPLPYSWDLSLSAVHNGNF